MADIGNEWRFPGNNYTEQKGLNTSDMEMFKKDPIASLARETCQNSIDAKAKGKTKVKVEFKTFCIARTEIPMIDDLTAEIESCIEFKKNSVDISKELKKIHGEIVKPIINCLRISDFYTTGLTGVETDNLDSPFYLLTKGSGITDKFEHVGTSKGGSKGIGKFASFVASGFNTVFYSTLTEDNHRGYIGISKLCSSTIKGTDELTQGIGYFGKDYKNSPIYEDFSLEKGYHRTVPGTDIYILGFRDEMNWQKEIITKVLDSFMCAIVRGNLEISVDGILINEKNVGEYITDDYVLSKMINSIKAQYELLTDKMAIKETVDVFGYGQMALYLKSYKKEEANQATNNCVMVRHPLMKIKSFKDIASVPCSAMAIIEPGELNEVLRKIENPQHDDWQPKRADKDDQSEMSAILKEMKRLIITFVQNNLANGASDEADIEGAGDFLPETSDTGSSTQEEEVEGDKPYVTKVIVNKVKEDAPTIPDEDASGLEPNIGQHTSDGDDSPIPTGHNEGSGGDNHDGSGETGYTEDGDQEILTLVPIRDARCRMFAVNKKQGKYIISVDTLNLDRKCELQVFALDDSNNKELKPIISLTVNGKTATIEKGIAKDFQLNAGKNKMEIEFEGSEYFGCEVKLYAYR